MNIKGIIKMLVLALLLMLLFHPIISVILLVKFGGVLFAVLAISVTLKLALGKSILDLFKTD